jgi:hypothetical protein
MNKKYFKLFSIISIAILCYCFFSAEIQASEVLKMSPPKISLYYAETFDDVCGKKLNYNINSSWRNELINRMPSWKNLWDSEGFFLLKTSIQIVERNYPQADYKTAISLCSFPSMSAPLIVNGRYVLNNFTKNPITDDVFISTIFHEICTII